MRSADTLRPPDSARPGLRRRSAIAHPRGSVRRVGWDRRTRPGATPVRETHARSRALRLSSRAHASASVRRCAPGTDSCRPQPTASQAGEHRATLHRRLAQVVLVVADDVNLRHVDLAVGTRAGWDWRPRVKWSTGYGQLPRYFFLGPLLTMGGLGADLVRLPPRFDIVESPSLRGLIGQAISTASARRNDCHLSDPSCRGAC